MCGSTAIERTAIKILNFTAYDKHFVQAPLRKLKQYSRREYKFRQKQKNNRTSRCGELKLRNKATSLLLRYPIILIPLIILVS